MPHEDMSMHPAHLDDTPSRSIWGPIYLGAWVVLAAGATAYLGALALAPEAIRISVSSEAVEETTDLRALLAESRIEGDELARQVERLSAELSAVKADIAEVVSAGAQASVSLPLDEPSIVVPAKGAKPAAAATKPAAIEDAEVGETGTLKAPAEQAAGPDLLDAFKEAVSDDTKSEDADQKADWGSQIAALPERKPAASRTFGLEIARSTSPEALQVSWGLLSERHVELLGGMKAVTQLAGADSQDYRLVTGPFATAAAARSLCAKLEAAGVTCRLTPYAGNVF